MTIIQNIVRPAVQHFRFFRGVSSMKTIPGVVL